MPLFLAKEVPMRILVVSDVWRRQTSGVVTTLTNLQRELAGMGHELAVMHPGHYPRMPTPMYPEIPMGWPYRGTMARKMRQFRPDAIHIMSEHTFCLAVRNWCVRNRVPFTTSFATRIAEYVRAHAGIPEWVTWRYLRWFHSRAVRTTTALPSLERDLASHGFRNLVRWSRGVDAELFRPYGDRLPGEYPVFTFVGRVSREKNIPAFLDLDLPGMKWVVGDGPQFDEYREQYPDVHFTGALRGEVLARTLAGASVMVFPSRTDTFGVVVLEANACDVPVACFPVPGPGELVANGVNGYALENLQDAALRCLRIRRGSCRDVALRYTWRASAEQFLAALAPISAAP
jgi:glycosyltransferase involved in cell wall biosynthesis